MRKRVPAKDVSLVSQTDWARLAAFIDGEGHVQIAQSVHKDPKWEGARQRYEYINIVVSNTDPRLMIWLEHTFGGRVYKMSCAKPLRWSQGWKWHLSCRQAATVLEKCLPYLLLKREQAELALAMQATMNRCGVRGTPPEVILQRDEIRRQLKALTKKGPEILDHLLVN